MNLLDAVQWPAMVVTVAASWFVASRHKHKRSIGFWLFLVSNVAWVVWGLHTGAWALIVLQVCLVVLNIRGAAKASDDADAPARPASAPSQKPPFGDTSAST